MPSSSKLAAERKRAGTSWDKYRVPKYRADRLAKQERAVAHALTRVRSARGHLAQSRGAHLWQVALAARQAEYERELLALERLITRGTV